MHIMRIWSILTISLGTKRFRTDLFIKTDACTADSRIVRSSTYSEGRSEESCGGVKSVVTGISDISTSS